MEIKPYSKNLKSDVLNLLERSQNTSRTELSWEGNNMTGVLAYKNDKIIGAIPLEPRDFTLANQDSTKLLWVSGAHVDQDFRSQGIGGKLDHKIKEHFKDEYNAIFVYRENENSPAYKWYDRMGYTPLLPILAFHKTVKKPEAFLQYRIYKKIDDIEKIEMELFNCFKQHHSNFSGIPKRNETYWSKRVKSHCYKKFYEYTLLTFWEDEKIKSFALLGKNEFT